MEYLIPTDERPFRFRASTVRAASTAAAAPLHSHSPPSLDDNVPAATVSTPLLEWFDGAEQFLRQLEHSDEDATTTLEQLRTWTFSQLLEEMRTAWCRATTPDQRAEAEARYYQASVMALIAYLLESHANTCLDRGGGGAGGDRFVASEAVTTLVAVWNDVCTVQRCHADHDSSGTSSFSSSQLHPCPMFELCWGCHGTIADDPKTLDDILRLGIILPQRVQRAQQHHAEVLRQQLYHNDTNNDDDNKTVGRRRRRRLQRGPRNDATQEYDLTWGVLLVYIMGRWACWQRYHEQRPPFGGDDVVLSWTKDIEPMVTALFQSDEPLRRQLPSLAEYFPRLLPEQTLAGLAMLQLDILANELKVQWSSCNSSSSSNNETEMVYVHDISPWRITTKYLMQNEFAG